MFRNSPEGVSLPTMSSSRKKFKEEPQQCENISIQHIVRILIVSKYDEFISPAKAAAVSFNEKSMKLLMLGGVRSK